MPPSSGSMPKTARASSVRPAPISPASPRISPRRTVEVDRARRPGGGARRPRSPGSARPAPPPAGGRSTSGRARSSAGSSPRARSRRAPRCPTTRPSRSTTTRSAQAVTSPSRCEMKMTLTPDARRSATTLEQPLGLGDGQARGRLVHDDEPALERQRLGDLDELALRDRQPRHRRRRREVHPEPGEDRLDRRREPRAGRPAAAARPCAARGRSSRWRRRRGCRRGSAPGARRRCRRRSPP